jgi:ribonuclease VapC
LTVVLDASALLALIKAERGWDAVDAVVAEAVIAAVNLGEAAQREFKAGRTREQFDMTAAALGVAVEPVDARLAVDAAEFRERGRAMGLSQADCIFLALARRLGAEAMTADRKWIEVAEAIGVEVRVIR